MEYNTDTFLKMDTDDVFNVLRSGKSFKFFCVSIPVETKHPINCLIQNLIEAIGETSVAPQKDAILSIGYPKGGALSFSDVVDVIDTLKDRYNISNIIWRTVYTHSYLAEIVLTVNAL